MSKKPKKKRIILGILLTLLVLILTAVAVPIVTLYVQYRNISYTPMEPVERTDVYVLPEYPEVIPGSEGITDLPDDPEPSDVPTEELPPEPETAVPETEAAEIPPAPETEAPETAAPETEAAEPPPEPETEVPETDAPPAEPETTAPPVKTETSAPETLPSVTTPAPVQTAPQMNPNNSFANSNTISVYGRTPIYKVEQKDSNIMNILVLGTDSRDVAQDRGRSDTMIVVSYNKKTHEIKLVSLLRDLLVPIEGYNWNRINTAYFYDGVGLSINTVNQLFGLDIQHFIVIDFNGAKDFIDYVGGVDLQLSESEANYVGVPYSSEPTHLDGSAALKHMRNRSSDSDFGRTARQRTVVMAVISKIISEKSLTEILDITQYALGMVKTNLSASSLASLAASVMGSAGKISLQSQNIPYEDAYQFAWYNKMAILSFDIQSTAKRLLEFLYG